MKKLFTSSLLALSFVLFGVSTVFAQGVCNQRCDVDQDCGQGYRCYVGVCRLQSCPASNTCACAGKPTATPTPVPTAPLITRPTAVPTQTPTPTPTATPKPTATPTPTPSPTPKPTATVLPSTSSAALKQSPKTGFGALELLVVSFFLFIIGNVLAHKNLLLTVNKTSAFEMSEKRQHQKRETINL